MASYHSYYEDFQEKNKGKNCTFLQIQRILSLLFGNKNISRVITSMNAIILHNIPSGI